eukprot:CAMPEP_0194761898 /NCGR_PEP_ID=MMETSP0323_2-20130528/14511_1 /TAXON_ID=2866 ORGANISM="Crypthecodinium cohnii, Strain Seligo" /NCGR_SAMPLE_ID=MMETSP0323_2 /ASSEMBLY_ACC=CAM_ASM_000346 /LENGTH=178 /DNA_ID=CAMNT_0039683833 /DNA_START=1 /DNA_END=537 /DNA_ORIENTATION=+
MKGLLTRLHSLLKPNGRLIGTIPNSDSLQNLYTSGMQGQQAVSGDGLKVGNDLYQIVFKGDCWKTLPADNDALLDRAFGQEWGRPYSFSLEDAVDEQTEYVLPWEAFVDLAEQVGFTLLMDGTFEDMLKTYSPKSTFYNDFFSKDPKNTELSDEELELFGLYSGFCFVKASPAAASNA